MAGFIGKQAGVRSDASPRDIDSMRYPAVGVGIVVVVMLLAASLVNHKRETECAYQPAPEYCQDAAQRGGFAVLPLTDQHPNANDDAGRNQWRSEQDLYAQRQMAEAAWYAVLVAHRYAAVSRDFDRKTPDSPYISAEKARYHETGNEAN